MLKKGCEALAKWIKKTKILLVNFGREFAFYWSKKWFKTLFIAIIVVGIVLFIDMLAKGTTYDGNTSSDVGLTQSNWGFIAWRSQFHTSTTFLDFIGGSIPHGLAIFLDWLIITALATWLYFSRTTFMTVAVSFTLGGVFGNTFDAMIFQGVRNCMFLPWHDNGTFNFADLFIMFGSGLSALSIILYVWRSESSKKNVTEITDPSDSEDKQSIDDQKNLVVDEQTGEVTKTKKAKKNSQQDKENSA